MEIALGLDAVKPSSPSRAVTRSATEGPTGGLRRVSPPQGSATMFSTNEKITRALASPSWASWQIEGSTVLEVQTIQRSPTSNDTSIGKSRRLHEPGASRNSL